jgi:glycosyltransferase involved in cell wall biosynthesis
MRVLVAHNRYRSTNPSGENKIVDAEIALLQSGGVEVVPVIEDSDRIQGLRRLSAAVGPLYASPGVHRFRQLLRTEQPDVVHLHNVFPLISPAVVLVARRRGIPVVQTVHNYRHSCAKGLHFRDGHNCTDCLGRRLAYPAVLHGCYRDSRAQSVPMALSQAVHHETWNRVSRYLALTPFMKDLLARHGVDKSKITIRPTWVPDPGAAAGLGDQVLFVGRLDEVKGVRLLLDAWSKMPESSRRQLHIVGDGPLREHVASAAASDPTIEYSGSLDSNGVSTALTHAAYVVVGSLWYEGYPLVIAEAFAHGRPVLVVEGSSAASVVDEAVGWTSRADPDALAQKFASITDDDVRRKAVAARRRYEAVNAPSAALQSLLQIYGELMDET